MTSLPKRLVAKVVTLRDGEGTTALLMFAYSFLAMTAYNILRPVTKSKAISALGPDNLPYVLLAAGVFIGLLMHVYSYAAVRVPRRWVIPATQVCIVGILLLFWTLFQTFPDANWVSAAFYVFGLLLGVLLINQFWMLANDIYDARQAKRLFGFIGGGASLGGAIGSWLTVFAVHEVGANNLVLLSAALLVVAIAVVARVGRHLSGSGMAIEERGVGGGEALRLLRSSRQLQVIALVVAFAAIGAGLIDQQLNMAAAAFKGEDATNALTDFLAQVQGWVSIVGLVIQVGFTSRIHRSLGLAVALLMLPVGFGTSAIVILLTGSWWAPALARVVDASLRYTIDKTTREVLFLPVPPDLKLTAKPFIDVTMDRFAKAVGALVTLVLIKSWGLGLTWEQLSYASLAVTMLWIVLAVVARREYLKAFRESIATRAVAPTALGLGAADPSTVEALIEELSSPDEASVLYAIDMLETFEKRNLITPLLLHHPSSKVRARVLRAFKSLRAAVGEHWAPAVEALLTDDDPEVRSGAMRALATVKKDEAPSLLRHYLDDPAPRVSVTAAVVLATSASEADRQAAEIALERLVSDTRQVAAASRREVAAGLAHIPNAAFQHLLIALIHDADVDVAREAVRTARMLQQQDPMIVPALAALLSHRLLKREAREALVSYGDGVVPMLTYVVHDPDEQVWVRRHIPGTLAELPTQASLDALAGLLGDRDGFLRFKAIEAIEAIRRDDPALRFDGSTAEPHVLRETARYCNYLTLRQNLLREDPDSAGTLIVRALTDKLDRALDRTYRLLGLIYPWREIADARYTIEHGTDRLRASAIEYLDNLLRAPLRGRVLPLVEDVPIEEKVRHANLVLKTRPRDLEDTLAQLIHDDDQVISASAILYVERRNLWATLEKDVEYVLGHRLVDDWFVFEAASWALGSRRMGERRDALWLEPLPVVELADRLRGLPLFDEVSADELFRIARAGRQIGHEGGRRLAAHGEAGDVQFLLGGSVRVSDADRAYDLQAPAALSFEAMLEGRPVDREIHTVDRVVCLRIGRPEFLTMLSDSVELTQGLFRALLRGSTRTPHALVSPGPQDPTVGRDDGLLQPIERARRLREHPFFRSATTDQLLDLVSGAHEIRFREGEVLFREHDPPALLHLIEGEVRLDTGTATPAIAGPGSTLCTAETLAGLSPGCRATVITAGRALRLDRDALFVVLADHVELLQTLFSGALRATDARIEHAAGPARV